MTPELKQLGDTLDSLVELLFAESAETRGRAEFLIRELMWDNKIGIIRTLQRGPNEQLPEDSKGERP